LKKNACDKPDISYVCKKVFSEVGHLQTNMLTHSSDKPFLCKVFEIRRSNCKDH
jgi:hypothetical protein